MHIHSELKTAIENDNVVFFIGAGFSKDLGFPDWNGLIKNIIEKLSENDETFRNFIPLINNKIMTPIEVLEKIKENKNIIRSTLVDSFEIDLARNELINKTKKYELIWRISQKIITTNYDKSLERSNREIEDAYIPLDDDFKLSEVMNKNKFYFKIHGCISSPTKCVLLKEDYEDLYNNDKLAKFQLKNIISNKTIVFLGFSLSDPYVNYVFESINKLFNGYNNKHFILTTNDDNFKKYGVENIKLNNWGEIDNFLEDLLKIKEDSVLKISLPNPIETTPISNIKKENVKVAVLTSNPIDRKLDFDDEIIKINKLKCQIDHYSLNMENIHSCNDYDYLFILSDEIKGKLVIENDVLTSRLISLKEFEDNLCNSNLKAVIVLTKNNNIFEHEDSLTEGYIVFPILEKSKLETVLFQLFRKNNMPNELSLINDKQIKLVEINSENIQGKKTKPSYLSEKIDRKNLKNFVGRESDFREIIKKIFELKSDEKVLVLKGAGGLGKTTLIKKIAIELSERSAFSEGIYFFDCEFIKSTIEFQREIAKTFGLEFEMDFFNYLENNHSKIDKLLIIDNFETLIYNDEIDEIKNIISKVTDYASIVVTSREVLSLDYEEVYEIRNFNSDEAEELFFKEINQKIKLSAFEKKILREDILENLLGNNPLAITLITPYFYKGMSIESLKNELIENFSIVEELSIMDLESANSDRNIEKKQRLASSILFSYNKLTTREKFIFELLSLFPDGVYIENLKLILRKTTNESTRAFHLNIGDIISLEKKSLIENNNGNIRLQSIIFRFSENRLNQRENLDNFYDEVFQYNFTLLDMILKNDKQKRGYSYITLKLLEANYRNFLKVFEFIEKLRNQNNQIIKYFDRCLSNLMMFDNLFELKSKLLLSKNIFNLQNEKIYLKVSELYLDYFLGDFKSVEEEMKTIIYTEDFTKYNLSNSIYYSTLDSIFRILITSGIDTKDYNKIILSKKLTPIYEDLLFRIGDYYSIIYIDDFSDFFELEKKLNKCIIELKDVERALSVTHGKEALNLMQLHYIKVKMGYGKKEEVQKLLSINPYTRGLKALMFGILEIDIDKAKDFYERALGDLEPIKYYYIEALYFYSKFLKENSMEEEYQMFFNLGIELSQKFLYRFQYHRLVCLKDGIEKPYNELDYPIEDEEALNVINKMKKELEKNS